MKVLVVQESLLAAGGSETVVIQTLQALRDIGTSPVAVCAAHERSLLQGVKVYETPNLFWPKGRLDLDGLRDIIHREKPELIHVHKVASSRVIRFVAERLPTIVTVHGHNAYCPGGSKVFWRTGTMCRRPLGYQCLLHAYVDRCAARHPARLWRHFLRSKGLLAALGKVKRVLTLSQYVRARLVDSGLDEGQVRVLEPWVQLPPPSSAEAPNHTVLFVGRIVREKGLPGLLEALALVSAQCRAVIVGDGPLRAQCEELVRRLGIGDHVEFRGWLGADDLHMEYARCAMLVFPSFWPEPFGLAGIEAMAHGKPIVATDVGGVREWLLDGVTGILVQRGDVSALAGAIQDLLANHERRDLLGAAARTYVAEHFNQGTNFKRLLANYGEFV